jgi:hypothetical protein
MRNTREANPIMLFYFVFLCLLVFERFPLLSLPHLRLLPYLPYSVSAHNAPLQPCKAFVLIYYYMSALFCILGPYQAAALQAPPPPPPPPSFSSSLPPPFKSIGCLAGHEQFSRSAVHRQLR